MCELEGLMRVSVIGGVRLASKGTGETPDN